MVQQYPNDLEPSLAEELVHFRQCFKGKNLPDKEDVSDDLEEAASVKLQMYRIVAKRNIREVFPNVEIALRIYLTLMVSNCSGERSFSALKRIKNVLRSTMTDQKLNNLSPMCIFYAKSTSRILLKSLRLVNAANQSCKSVVFVITIKTIKHSSGQEPYHKRYSVLPAFTYN